MTDQVYRRMLLLMTGDANRLELDFEVPNGTINPIRLRVPSHDITLTPTLMMGDYEFTAREAFLRLVPTGGTVIDVGANIGLYSLLAASAVGPAGAVYAFEPIADNIELARQNIDLNDAGNVVRLITKAVGDRSGTLTMYRSPDRPGTHSAGYRTDLPEQVEMVSLDDWIDATGLTSTDVVKIDVEGYDGFVLEGALATLHRYRPTLLIEWAPAHLRACGYDPARLAQHLFGLGGVCLAVNERRQKLYPVMNQAELVRRLGRAGSNVVVTHRPQAIADLIGDAATQRSSWSGWPGRRRQR
jgi:FkbM family methyltransferase